LFSLHFHFVSFSSRGCPFVGLFCNRFLRLRPRPQLFFSLCPLSSVLTCYFQPPFLTGHSRPSSCLERARSKFYQRNVATFILARRSCTCASPKSPTPSLPAGRGPVAARATATSPHKN
jgi:hypothetical protein